MIDQRRGSRRGRDVAADHLNLRKTPLHRLHAIEHALRMPVRGVDDDDVDAGRDQCLDTRFGVLPRSDRGADAQAPEFVLAGARMLGGFQDVLDGDETAQLMLAIDDEHPFQAVAVHERLRRFEIGALRHGHELLRPRHDLRNRLIEIRLEAQVAVGDDPDDLPPLDDRQSGNSMLVGERQHLAHRHRGWNRDRILDDAAFEALDLRDLRCLPRRRHVLVDDAKAPFLRDRDRQAGLGHRVHGRGKQRDIERNRACEAGGERNVAGNDAGVGRNE